MAENTDFINQSDSDEQNSRVMQEFYHNLKALNETRSKNKIDLYQPYPKQQLFHAMGIDKDERLLSAGNQLGKTFAGSYEAAYHATGQYPKNWKGRKWDRPTKGWVGGESSTVVRDTSQALLLGDLSAGIENLGTGAIPADCILNVTWHRGVAMGVDTVTIKHKSGGKSKISFKSYEQNREKWQGATIDWVWFDEEPPADIYSEGLARFSGTEGMAWMTFTPLKGMSTVVKRFKNESNELRGEVIMTAHDAKHITEEGLKKLLSKYPEHEHECRINGVPMQGEGRIYQMADSTIKCAPFDIPDHWTHILGMDIGHGDHPTAGVWMAHDRDQDTTYIYREYREKSPVLAAHAAAFKSGGRIQIAWPQDVGSGDKIDGTTMKKHYQGHSCWMLNSPARFPDDRGNSVWAGIEETKEMMLQGRFKVFSSCPLFFDEYRNYHLDDGKIVKKDDDLLDAARYAIMMLNQAKIIDRNWYPGQRRKVMNTVAPGTDFDPMTGK